MIKMNLLNKSNFIKLYNRVSSFSTSHVSSKILVINKKEDNTISFTYEDIKHSNAIKNVDVVQTKPKVFGSLKESPLGEGINSNNGKETVKENKLKTKSYFSDKCRVYFKGGDGGNGMIAFDKGPMLDQNRPDGGCGGKGGDIILVADRTIYSLAYVRKGHFTGNNGYNGKIRGMDGRLGKDITINLPIGTIVNEIIRETDVNKKQLRNDLPYKLKYLTEFEEHGQKLVISKGGSGGLGNSKGANRSKKQLLTAYNITDENRLGRIGQEKEIELELRCVSDVCLLGFPNAGKSTLMASVRRNNIYYNR